MKRFILSLSQTGLVAMITLLAILLANGLNYLISIYFEGEFTRIDFIRSTIIPIVLAPLLSWYLVSRAFKLASVEKELTRLATYDSLTNLFSRSAFLSKANLLFKQAQSNQQSFSVILLDLDHFKSVNDNFGHDAGDYVLYKFGEIIKNLGLSNHICGRVGGEEFAFALINMDLDDSKQFAELIRKKLINTIMIYNTREINITASSGVTSYQNDELTFQELMIQADKALYAAKNNGRNQTMTFSRNHDFSNYVEMPS